MRRPEAIARQSGHPIGLVGHLIATVMALETAAVNKAAIALLQLRGTDRVIDVGTGHGRGLRSLAAATPSGLAVGVDHSAVMCAHARRHTRLLGIAGRVQVVQAGSDTLPFQDGHFDAALSVHTLYFWQPAEKHLREIARVLKPTGRLVLAFTPSGAASTRNFPESVYRFRSADEVLALLHACGFTDVELFGGDTAAPAVVFARARRLEDA